MHVFSTIVYALKPYMLRQTVRVHNKTKQKRQVSALYTGNT
jgi:hypothetical protein